MTNKVLITLSCGTDNPNRTTRAVFFAMAAHKEGKSVTLFLLDEGVFIAKKGMADHIKAATGDACDDHLSYLQAHDVSILVCTPCARARQIEDGDLIEGARMATGGEMIQLACDSAVLSF